jgi:hypothetical protein
VRPIRHSDDAPAGRHPAGLAAERHIPRLQRLGRLGLLGARSIPKCRGVEAFRPSVPGRVVVTLAAPDAASASAW